MDTETNPGVEDAPEVEDLRVEDAEIDPTETDDEGNPVEPEPEDDSEEIEYEGQKHRVPKALKDAFLRQADYTRKTQEVAQMRQDLAQRVQTVTQATEAEAAAQRNLALIDAQLEQAKLIDWDQWFESDPVAAQKEAFRLQQLRDAKGGVNEQLSQARQAREAEAQRISAERLQQGATELARDIPGWGPEKATALLDFGHKQYGFSHAELSSIDDPKLIKVLHDAFEHRKAASKQSVQRKAEAVTSVKPAAKVGGTSPPGKLDDRVSTEAWMARRNAELAKRR